MSAPSQEVLPWIVTGVGLWLPGVADHRAWRAGARGCPQDEAPPPEGALLDRRTRRRSSGLCRALADAFADAALSADVPLASVSSVFGSSLGEVSTMLTVLEQLTRGEDLSPMHFATSVHNTASGMVSISNVNRGFTTALSADFDTVGAALCEASGLLAAHGEPVVVVCADERSPERFVAEEFAFDMLAAAIVLEPKQPGRPALARIGVPSLRTEAPRVPVAPLSPRLARNPQVGLVDLVGAILAGSWGDVALDRGLGHGWGVRVESPDS